MSETAVEKGFGDSNDDDADEEEEEEERDDADWGVGDAVNRGAGKSAAYRGAGDGEACAAGDDDAAAVADAAVGSVEKNHPIGKDDDAFDSAIAGYRRRHPEET